jgi:uncharacterized protein YuzE
MFVIIRLDRIIQEEVFMKIRYYADTDSLYIDLTERASVESLEVAPDIVVDFDENNNIVGIDINHASKILNLSDLEITSVPTKKLVLESPA